MLLYIMDNVEEIMYKLELETLFQEYMLSSNMVQIFHIRLADLREEYLLRVKQHEEELLQTKEDIAYGISNIYKLYNVPDSPTPLPVRANWVLDIFDLLGTLYIKKSMQLFHGK